MLATTAFAQSHDGRWWESIIYPQKSEYLNGYMDCATYDAGRRDLPSVGTDEIIQAIRAFYDSHPKSLDTPVITVLDIVAKQQSMHRKPLAGGEVWTNKHGYYDGEYWPISDVERTGFVQGLRECYASIPSGPHFSRSDEFYVRSITAWYNDPKHSHQYKTSIAVILALYADRQPASSVPRD
jgi:hypothetical protein